MSAYVAMQLYQKEERKNETGIKAVSQMWWQNSVIQLL